jgi:hypothetical protein
MEVSPPNHRAETGVFSKSAARAGIKRIRDLLAQGEHNPAVQSELQALTSRAGDILTGRKSPLGSQLRVLGAGGEGAAQHVLTPQGMKVLKVHDPTAMAYSPKVIANKDSLVGKEIPGFANIESKHQMPGRVAGRQVPAYMNEYVPGHTMSESDFASGRAKDVLERGHQGVGNLELADLNRTNFKVTPSGESKVIDYMPIDKQDMYPRSERGRANVLHENINPASPTFSTFNVERPGHVSLEGSMGPKVTSKQYAGKLLNQAYNPAASPALPQGMPTVRPASPQAATVRPGAVNRAQVPPMQAKALASPRVPSFETASTDIQPSSIQPTAQGQAQSQYTLRPSAMPPG